VTVFALLLVLLLFELNQHNFIRVRFSILTAKRVEKRSKCVYFTCSELHELFSRYFSMLEELASSIVGYERDDHQTTWLGLDLYLFNITSCIDYSCRLTIEHRSGTCSRQPHNVACDANWWINEFNTCKCLVRPLLDGLTPESFIIVRVWQAKSQEVVCEVDELMT
jgi:hypothetical protein